MPVHLAANPFWILLHSWRVPPGTWFLRDAIVNVVLYVPLGFVGYLAFRRSRLPGFAIYGPVLLGLCLSVAMELVQLLEPSRTTSMIDVITNIAGSVFGVGGGLLFSRLAPGRTFESARSRKKRRPDRSAGLLALCWAAWLLFPAFPLIGIYEPRQRLGIFLRSHLFDPVLLVSHAAAFFAAGLLIAAAGVRISRPWFFATVLAIPAQFFIAGRQPVPAALLGAIVGALLFAARPSSVNSVRRIEAWLFLGVLLFRGLSPFRFVPGTAGFDWVPFEAALTDDWQIAAGILLEKIFYYGTAIWLLRAAGMTLRWAVVVVAAVLLGIEIAQTHLPGRTPEITDPILAIVMGFVLAIFSRRAPASTTPDGLR